MCSMLVLCLGCRVNLKIYGREILLAYPPPPPPPPIEKLGVSEILEGSQDSSEVEEVFISSAAILESAGS